MKTLEELASTLTTTSIADLVPKIILDEVEEAARARRFGRSLLRINDDLVRTKGRSIVIGRRGTVSASSVVEGQNLSASAQGITYTSNTLTPTKVGCAVHITQEAIEGCELNLIRDSVTEAGIALAEKEDTDIMVALLKYTAGSTIAAGAATLAPGGPLVYADESLSQVTKVDYTSGSIVVTGACTVVYYKSTYTSAYYTDMRDDPGGQTLWTSNAYEAIVNGVTKVKARKWVPKFLVIHPEALGGVLKSTMFIDASKYGSNEPIVNGEIGKIAGLKVLTTTQMPSGAALVIDNNRAAWMAVRRNLDMKRWDNPQTDSIELYFYVEYSASVTDSEGLQVVIGITTKSVPTV